jgi:hypothetical protein
VVVLIAARAWGHGHWPWRATGRDVGGWGVMAIAGPTVHSSDIDKREKEGRLTFKMWTREAVVRRVQSCIEKPSVFFDPLLFSFFLGSFRVHWGRGSSRC